MILFSSCISLAENPSSVLVVRWSEGDPNCTVRAADDGHVYYGLSSGDYEITLAVDRQELEKMPHRVTPMLGVLLSFKYKGDRNFEVQQNRVTLEFVKHFQLIRGSLDPDWLVQNLQEKVDDLTDEVERHQIRKHPEKKEKAEAELQVRLKDYTEMMDFVSTRSLRPGTLNASKRSVDGWVFFSTTNRWLGSWRRPEQFILRLPVENAIVEFPFQLPPQQGKPELRKREP